MPDLSDSNRQQEGDYEVQVKVRNGRILARVRALGYPSMAAFCRARALSYQKIVDLVTMRQSAVTRDGVWRRPVLALAAALDVAPEDLFTARQIQGGVESTVVRYVDEDQLVRLDDRETQGLLSHDEPQDEVLGRHKAVAQFLDKLPPQHRRVIEGRYGLGGQPAMTYEDLASEFGVSKERIRQIEIQALKKAGSPTWQKTLRPYADPDYDPEDLSKREITTRVADIRERARQAAERDAARAAEQVRQAAERDAALQLFKEPQWQRLPLYLRQRWRSMYSDPLTYHECIREAIAYVRKQREPTQ